MSRISAEFVGNRPVAGVFAFIASFENRMQYEEGLIEVEQTSEGPFGLGSTGRDVMKAMGRRMESTAEIAAFEQDKAFTFRSTSGPMEFEGTWTFEPLDSGTKVALVAEGRMKGLMRLFEPLIARKFRAQIDGNTARVKELLESQA